MSIVAAPLPARQRYAHALRQFASTRWLEVSALQAGPLLGMYLGGGGLHASDLGRQALLLLGSVALTAHVFLLNDWADHSRDARDLRPSRPTRDGVGRGPILRVAIVLLILANAAFAAVGTSALLFGAGIAVLSLLYSLSPGFGKKMPVAASLDHLIGGAFHFLLGYSIGRAVDARGVALGLVVGFTFAAGHLNQEVRDHEFDLTNGIGTVAVTFGRRAAFLASFCLFTAAYLVLVVLAALGVLSALLLAAALAWLVQARWSVQALRRGLDSDTALWMQRRYRLLFALVGLAMLYR